MIFSNFRNTNMIGIWYTNPRVRQSAKYRCTPEAEKCQKAPLIV